MTAADLPLVRRWLAEPHVARMVGRSLTSNSNWSAATSRSRPWTSLSWRRTRVRSDTSSAMIPTSGRIIGLGDHPRGTRGIDQFIGELGHGRTAAMDRRLSAPSSIGCWRPARRASSPIPTPPIARAIRAYEKAGFRTRPPGRYARWRGPADGAQPMTLERNAPAAVAGSFQPGNGC